MGPPGPIGPPPGIGLGPGAPGIGPEDIGTDGIGPGGIGPDGRGGPPGIEMLGPGPGPVGILRLGFIEIPLAFDQFA